MNTYYFMMAWNPCGGHNQAIRTIPPFIDGTERLKVWSEKWLDTNKTVANQPDVFLKSSDIDLTIEPFSKCFCTLIIKPSKKMYHPLVKASSGK